MALTYGHHFEVFIGTRLSAVWGELRVTMRSWNALEVTWPGLQDRRPRNRPFSYVFMDLHHFSDDFGKVSAWCSRSPKMISPQFF